MICWLTRPLFSAAALSLAAALSFAAALLLTAPARAELPVEATGQVASMPAIAPHWVFVPDRLLQHSLIYDGDSGDVLGTVDSGMSIVPKLPLVAHSRNEIYALDVAYARGKRGARMDFVTIYDATTLAVLGDVPLPTMAAESNQSLAYFAILDGERFVAVFNQFPEVSVTIVDVEERRVAGTVPTAGCAGIFPAGPRRFAMLCGDGSALLVTLDEQGRRSAYVASERFFDAVVDPVVLSAGRRGDHWLFVSFEGVVHELDFRGATPEHDRQWSLLDERDRDARWRPGGLQYVAVHAATDRLYVVMHQGGPGTHKDAGPEIWVYDAAAGERSARFPVPNLTAAFLGPLMGIESGSFSEWLLERLLPSEGAHTIAVSQDETPLLFARNGELGAVAVLDALSGEHLRTLREAGIAGPTLGTP